MSTLKDKKGREWRIELDAPLIEEVQEKHGINLVNLDGDPMIKLRNDPMKLVPVLYLICQQQIKELGLNPSEFGGSLPHVDYQLAAVREAIVSFFPSGRASHVAEVLTKYEEMNAKTDELAIAKMRKVMNDPKTMERLQGKANTEFDRAMREMFPLSSELGT